MLHHRGLIQSIRRIAGPVLLGVFVLAGQLAPVGHLATHRNDHTHGPEFTTLGDAAHEAAHRAGRAHDHGEVTDDALTPEERAWLSGEVAAAEHSDETPSHDHGRESAAHFGLALLQGPPPPLVPPPAEAVAAPPDEALLGYDAPALPQPPSRGPPACPGSTFAA